MTPARTPRPQLIKRIEELTETVQELRARTEKLEAERDELQKENLELRRELTQSRLLERIKQFDEEKEGEAEITADPPSTAEHLYQTLPAYFSFSVFFQIAEGEDLDMDTARRCLRHFLDEDLIVQEGSRLTKRRRTFEEEW